jgi:hypothetical protein
MKPQEGGELGLQMDKMDGILVLPWNITDVIQFISQKLEGIELWKQLIFFPKKHFTISFSSRFGHSSRTDLTHNLVYPQPAGQFLKVGDGQTIALERLANIFEGAKRRKSKDVITPTARVENAAPQRVQTTV